MIGCLETAHIILRGVVVVWYLDVKTSCPFDESGMIGELVQRGVVSGDEDAC